MGGQNDRPLLAASCILLLYHAEELLMNRGKNGLIVSFLALPLLLYTTFVLLPYMSALVFAFTRWSGLSANIRFNGFNNFIKLYGDEKFWNALRHNGIALVVLPPVIIGLGLFFAFLFTQGITWARFFRVAFFFPQVMSVVVIAVLWSFIYHPTIGLLNGFLTGIGLTQFASFPWLGDRGTVFGAVLAMVVWQSVGFYMVLFCRWHAEHSTRILRGRRDRRRDIVGEVLERHCAAAVGHYSHRDCVPGDRRDGLVCAGAGDDQWQRRAKPSRRRGAHLPVPDGL